MPDSMIMDGKNFFFEGEIVRAQDYQPPDLASRAHAVDDDSHSTILKVVNRAQPTDSAFEDRDGAEKWSPAQAAVDVHAEAIIALPLVAVTDDMHGIRLWS